MKKIVFAFIAALFLFTSCEKEDDAKKSEGKVEFSFSLPASSKYSSGRIESDSAAYVLLSIKDGSGKEIYTKKKITLYKFSDTFVSEPLALNPGSYALTEFFLLNVNNEVVYAIPVEGSQLEHLVADPLPVKFSVVKDQTVKVVPQVITANGISPVDFGYATFSFEVVKTVDFLISVFAFDGTTKNLELTSANLKIKSGSEVLFNKSVKDSTNQIFVREIDNSYVVVVEKQGYKTFEKTCTKAELATFKASPLIVVLIEKDLLMEGLLAYYPFDGNAKDSSGNNFHGTLAGPTFSTDRHGNLNKSVSFDGINDYITVAANSGYKPSFPITVSFWYYGKDIVKWGIVYTNDYLPNGYSGIFIGLDPDYKKFHMSYGNGTTGIVPWNRITYQSQTTIEPNKWYHVVSVYKSAFEFELYINNTKVGGSVDGSGGDMKYTNNGATFGRHVLGDGSEVFLYGKIDDFRMYNRKLSIAEINMLNKE